MHINHSDTYRDTFINTHKHKKVHSRPGGGGGGGGACL